MMFDCGRVFSSVSLKKKIKEMSDCMWLIRGSWHVLCLELSTHVLGFFRGLVRLSSSVHTEFFRDVSSFYCSISG